VECFPSDARVELDNGASVEIHNVKVGSLVKVINNDNQLSYSPIIAFLHYDSQTNALYKQIHTESDTIIELSSLHLIRRKRKNNLDIDEFIWAKEVVPDDQIFVVKQNNNTVIWEKVKFIKDVWKQGLMAPLTDQGTIVVNNVHTSCYASVKSHTIGHIALTPYRLYKRFIRLTETDSTATKEIVLSYANILFHIFKNIPIVKDFIF
ncbi:unnamed protein product, partial [Didymodactylos carnosus]